LLDQKGTLVTKSKADRIEALLDADCDETRVALYNPRSTVAAIRMVLAEPTEPPSYDEAWRVVERDYWDDVRGLVEECKRAVKDGEVSDDSELSDHLHEQVDGHQRVIYTHQARVGLCCTDNPEAYEDETGEKPPTVEAAMYYALMADVRRRLESFDDIKAEIEAEDPTRLGES
jgi:hypothetical protein